MSVDDVLTTSPVVAPPRPWWRPVLTRRDLAWIAGAVGLYLVLALILFWNVWTSDPSRVTNPGGDAMQSTWFFQWGRVFVWHGLNPLFTTRLNYPFGINLMDNTPTFLLTVLFSPVTALWGPIVSFNAACTFSFVASATAGFIFVRRFVSLYPAAIIGGLSYGFSPFMLAQGRGHLDLSFGVFPPLIFLVVFELLLGKRWTPRGWGITLGLLVTAQVFISTEMLVSTCVMGIFVVALLALFNRHLVVERARDVLIGSAWAAGVALLLAGYPVWFSLHGPGTIHGPLQLVAQSYRNDAMGLIVPDNVFRFAPKSLLATANRFTNSSSENGSYLGIPMLIFLVVGAIACWRRSMVVRVSAIAAGFAFVLSLGVALTINQPPGGPNAGVPLPYRLLIKLPLLNNAIPARYALYMDLFVGLLMAAILERFVARLRAGQGAHGRSSLFPAVATAVVVAIILVPLTPKAPFRMKRVPPPPSVLVSPQPGGPHVAAKTVLYPFPTYDYPIGVYWQAAADISFSMPGGGFLVPSAAGTVSYSPLLSYARTTVVATVLTMASMGRPIPQTPALRAAFRAELDTWGIHQLVAEPLHARLPARYLVPYLSRLLGVSPSFQSTGTVVWEFPPGRPSGR